MRGCGIRQYVLLPLLTGLLVGCETARGTPVANGTPAAAARADVRFSEVAAEMGLQFRWKTVKKSPLNILEISSAGAGFIDYNRDGWPDVVLVGPEGCALFRNEEGSRFRDVTREAGLDRLSGRWHGCASGDLDNDGWPDVLITGYRKQVLLRNLDGRRFADVTAQSGIDLATWGTSASFFDADQDGLLDLVVGSYVKFGAGSPEFMNRNGVPITLGPDAYEAEHPRFYRNLGGLRFREATRAAGFHVSMGKTFGTAVSDYDDDGDDDVYLANDEMPGNLFENDGRGVFADRGIISGTALSGSGKRQGGMGTAWGDYDNDLRPDLVVTTFTQEAKSLYRNGGDGLFTDRSYRSQMTQSVMPWVGFGVLFCDVNRDGHLDLPMVNGHVEDLIRQVDPANDYAQPMKLFVNRGDGTFEDATEATGDGFRRRIVGRALASADFDNDGDIDLLAADLEGAPVLLRNDAPPEKSHWIGLHLTGTGKSNRMAIGARIVVTSAAGRQRREVRTDGSYLSSSDPRVLIGLGVDTRVDEIEVRWPSGRKQVARNLAPDGYYRWREADQPEPVVYTRKP